jgi:hypothetical protein
MRNLTTAVSATVTSIVIALLIANVASAARAAEIAHDRDQRLAALQDSASANDQAAQLQAYETRYAQAYQQLAAAYQVLYARDAEYRAAVDRANAMSGQLADADASLETRLNDAYQALRDAQALVTALRGGALSTPAPPGPTARAATAQPVTTTTAPATSRPPAMTAGPAVTPTPRPASTRVDD